MTIEEIEELIRKYLSTGIAVVVILVAPGTATGGGAPEVITIDPSTPSDTRGTGNTGSNNSSSGTAGARPSGGTTGSGTGSSNSGTTGTRPSTSTNNGTTNNGTTNNGSSGTTGTRPGGSTTDTNRSGSTGSTNSGSTNSGTGSTGTRPGGTTNNGSSDTTDSGTSSGTNSGTNSGSNNNGTGSTGSRPGGTTNNGTTNNGSSGTGSNSTGNSSTGNSGSSGTNRSGSTDNGTGIAPPTGQEGTGGARSDTGSNRPRTGSTNPDTSPATSPDDERSGGSTTDDQRDTGNANTANGNNRTGNSSGTGNPSGTGSSDTGSDTTDSDTTDDGDESNSNDDAVSSTGSNSNSNNESNARGSDNSSSGVTAAEKFGWGRPNRSDDFSDGAGQWNIYDGPGHAGQGTRSPSAVSVDGGILTITGDSSGTTAGMAWNPGQKYGRWEGRVRAPASDPSYNALLLLWPDAENFPVGGEIDFMEMMDHTRQRTNLFLHYGEANEQVDGEVEIDATQWHNWALEWTPDSITAFVDGEEWFRTTDTSIFPPGPMHLCIQLDWFPEGDNPRESRMEVDWVRQYSLDSSGNSNSNTTEPENRSDHNPDEESTPVRNVIRKMFSWR